MTAHTYMARLFSLISFFFIITSVAYAQYMPFSFRNPLFQNVGTTNTYYVAANGNDNNDGLSPSSPFQTVNKINSIDLLPGDSVKFRAGDTFDGGIRKVLTYDNVGFPLVFTSYGVGRAKIRLSVNDTNGIYIEYPGQVKVHIDNLDIEGRYTPSTETGGQANSIGIYINNTTLIEPLESNGYSFIDIKNCLIHNFDLVGIAVYAENFGKTIITNIDNNQIYDIGVYGVTIENNWHSNSIIQNNTIKQIYGKTSSDPKGIYLGGCKKIDIIENNIHNIGERYSGGGSGILALSSRSINIKKNEIHGIYATLDRSAIRLTGCDSSVIDGNYIYNNQSYGVYILGQQSSGFGYLATDYITERGGLDSGASRFNNISNNIFKNNALSGTSVIRLNGVSSDKKANYISIFNNTIINSKTPNQKKGIYLDSYFNNTKILNNIILSDSGLTHFLYYNLTGIYSVVTSPLISENNLFWDRGLRGINFSINGVTKTINQLNDEYSIETSRLLYNPFLKAPFSTNDSLNNVLGLDTLTMYHPLRVSVSSDNGWDIANEAFTIPTEDFYGNQRLNGVGYDLGAFENTTTTYRYQPELMRWFGRDTTQPILFDTYKYDSLILNLKVDGIYQKLDLLYILAAPTSLLSRNQVIKDTFDLITQTEPSFTSYVGYTGNGSTTYLNTQWIPGIDNSQYQLNSSHFAVKTHLNLDENTVVLGTYAPTSLYNIWFRPKYNNSMSGTLNDAVFTPQSNLNAKGFYSINRINSNTKQYYKDGLQVGNNISAASNTLLTNRPLYLMALNTNGVTTASTNNKISFVGVGASLTTDENLKYAQHINKLINSFSIVDPPEIATLISPSNNSNNIKIDTSFNWVPSPSADSFRIEVSTDSMFTSPITRTVTYPPSSLLSNLAYNTTYYWRIIAINTIGETPSSKFKFTTGAPSITYTNTPQNMQLYARGVDDSASVTVSGSITTPSLDSLYIELYKSNVLVKRFSQNLTYAGQTAGFSQIARLKAGLHNYKFLVYTKRGANTYLDKTIDSVVAGDAYIVMGQSNAWSGGNGTYTYSDQFCRTFGIQTPNGNGDPYLAKDTLWSRSSAAFNTESAPNGNYPNNVGVWALQLQRMIRDTFGIPTVIINGAKHTTRIAEHIRDDNTPANLNTYYGKVLYRAQKAGLTNAIKGVFWYQGELNTDTSYQSYLSYFNILRTDWLTDYPNINQIFVFQPRPGCGFDQHDKLRERIRQLPGLYADVQLMSTIGFYNYNACHFFVDGYVDIGRAIFRNIGQKYYAGTDTVNSKPPNIRKAYFANQLKTQIRLLFNNSTVSSWPADTLGKRIKDYIYLDGVALGDTISSGSVSGDTVILNLTIPRNATTISYTPPLLDRSGAYFKWPLFKNARGLAALTFHNFTLTPPDTIFLQESIDLFARMTTISESRKFTIDSLIRKYKSHNVWGGDILYIFANSDTSAANLNWYSPNYTARRVNNPSFIVDKGYNFNGINSYLNSQYRPNISAVNYKLDSGSFAVYSDTSISGNTSARLFGVWTPDPNDSSYFGITPRTSDNKIYTNMADQSGSVNIANTNSKGLFLAVRRHTDTVKIYKDTILLGTNSTQKRGNLPANNIYIGAYNVNGVANYYFPGRISMFYVGPKLSHQQVIDFTNDTKWYLERVGVIYVEPPTSPPTLESPADLATDVDLRPSLNWSDIIGAEVYGLQVATDTGFTSIVKSDTTLANSNYSFTDTLLSSTNYYWRVKVKKNDLWTAYSARFKFTTSPYLIESLTLFAKMSSTATSPSTDRKNIIDSLIMFLKLDTIWQKADLMYVTAASDTGQANINWVNPDTYRLVKISNLNFVADEGWKSGPNLGHLTTQWIPFSNAVKYKSDSGTIAIYSRSDSITSGIDLGSKYSSGNEAQSDWIYFIAKDSIVPYGFTSLMNSYFTSEIQHGYPSLGVFATTRKGSTIRFYVNGGYIGSNSIAPDTMPRNALTIFKLSTNTAGSTAFGTGSRRQLSLIYVGGALSDYEHTTLTYRFNNFYMDRLNKSVLSTPIVYYVDSLSGNDSNTGLTPETAWKTSSKVNSFTFQTGDTVKFKAPYTYVGSITKTNAQVKNLTFTSYGSGKAILKTTTGGNLFYFSHSNTSGANITVHDLKLEGIYTNSNADRSDATRQFWSGINYVGTDSGTYIDSVKITVKNTEIKNFGIGVSLNNRSLDKLVKYIIDSNLVYNCVTGISTSGSKDSSKIRYNTVHTIWGHDSSTFGFGIAGFLIRNALYTRNLVYTVGENNSIGSVCIAISGASHNVLSYNEVYGAKANTADGDGLDLDWNSDSNVVEYNYSHNNDGAGLLISGAGYNWGSTYDAINYGYNWFFADSSQTSYNVVRYNIFKDNARKLGYGAITFYAESTNPNHKMKSNNIYNNTIIQSNKSDVTDESMIYFIAGGVGSGGDSTRIYNNIFQGDSVLFYNSQTNYTHTGNKIDNNIYWDSLNTSYNVKWTGSTLTLNTWKTNYTYETSNLTVRPFLNNPYAIRDTINNANKLDTLSGYKKLAYYPSGITDLGINFDSMFAYALLNQPSRGTVDFFGTTLVQNSKYDIGAYEDTSTYKWQDTTKLLFGGINKIYTTTDLYIYDSLIYKLQVDSLMRNARLLYIFGGPDTLISLRSIKLEDTVATSSGGPVFTPYIGYDCDGSNDMINTNIWAASSNGVLTYDKASIGILIRNNYAGDAKYDIGAYSTSGGTSYMILESRRTTSNVFAADIASNNPGTGIVLTDATSQGFSFANRIGSDDTIKFYKNGVYKNKVKKTKVVLPQYFMTVGGIRYAIPAGNGYADREYASMWYGNALTDNQQSNLYNHLTWYYERVGEPIFVSDFNNAYYVDGENGNDNNNGWSPETPWQTIGKLNSVTFAAGDTIKIKGGQTYTTTSTINIKNASLQNLTITSYGTGKPTLSINNLDTLMSLTHSNVDQPKISVKISNIIFTGPATNTAGYVNTSSDSVSRKIGLAYQVSDSTTYSATDSARLYIKNCEFSGFIRGIQLCNWFFDKPVRYTLDSNLIYNCVESGLQVYGSQDSSKYRYNKIYNIFGTIKESNTYGMNLAFARFAVASRNLIYNIGAGTSGGIGIATMGGSLNTISYNEVYGIKANAGDGHGIDLDNDMDSSVVEYNYIHNNAGAGILISGLTANALSQFAPYAFGFNWKLLNTSGSDRNIIRYNIAKNNARSTAISGNLVTFNAVNTHIGNLIYNNTSILQNTATSNEAMITMGSSNGIDSTRIYNNVFLGSNVLMFNFRGQTATGTKIYNNIFWDSANTYYQYIKYNTNVTTSITHITDTLGMVPNYTYNPQLINPWAVKDTVNNAWLVDTLSAFKKKYYPSSITDLGVNFDSIYAYALTGLPIRGTKDFYTTTLPNTYKYDIGAYEDTSTYRWQDTTKFLIGGFNNAYTVADMYIYDSLIYKLQVDSLMRNARLLYILGGPDESISQRSLKLEDTIIAKVGTIAFTPYVGYQSTGYNGYLKTQVNLTGANGIYTSDKMSFGVFIGTNSVSPAFDLIAYNATTRPYSYTSIRSRDSGASNNSYRITSNNYLFGFNTNLTDSSSKGFFLSNRIGSNDTLIAYKDAIRLASTVSVDSALSSHTNGLTIGYNSYGTAGSYTGRQYRAVWVGNGLTYTQQYNLNEHLKWYYWRMGQSLTAAPIPDASSVFASDTTGGLTKDNNILFTYTPIMKENDTLKMYYFAFGSYDTSAARYYRIISTNSGTTWINQSIVTITDLARDAIVRDPSNAGIYRMLYHKRQGSPINNDIRGYKIIPATSTDKGITFAGTNDDTLYKASNTVLEKVVGEDVSMLYDTDSSKYNIYFRPFTSTSTDGTGNAFRKIALSKTTNFDTYTYYGTILPVDTNNFTVTTSKDYRKSFYSMTVFKTASDEWWGLVNVMKHLNWTSPFDSGTVDVELVFSKNGIQWHRTNDSLAFIPRFTNVKQLFAYGTVVDNNIQIYGFYDILYHGDDSPRGANKWVVRRYQITIADLRKYKPYGI